MSLVSESVSVPVHGDRHTQCIDTHISTQTHLGIATSRLTDADGKVHGLTKCNQPAVTTNVAGTWLYGFLSTERGLSASVPLV